MDLKERLMLFVNVSRFPQLLKNSIYIFETKNSMKSVFNSK